MKSVGGAPAAEEGFEKVEQFLLFPHLSLFVFPLVFLCSQLYCDEVPKGLVPAYLRARAAPVRTCVLSLVLDSCWVARKAQ